MLTDTSEYSYVQDSLVKVIDTGAYLVLTTCSFCWTLYTRRGIYLQRYPGGVDKEDCNTERGCRNVGVSYEDSCICRVDTNNGSRSEAHSAYGALYNTMLSSLRIGMCVDGCQGWKSTTGIMPLKAP